MKKLIAAAFLFYAGQLFGQNQPCYTDYRSKGLDLMSRKNYGEAITQFVAGLVTCKDLPPDNDLARLVQEAKETWLRDLQASSERERKAYLEAVAAKDAAEKAQTEEKNARQEAVKNAEEAYKRGVRAESLRLALLADMARDKGQISDAVLLAWMSLQMSGESLPPFGVRAFCEAVADSFAVEIFNNSSPIHTLRYLPSGQRILLKTADGEHRIFDLQMPATSVSQLSPELLGVLTGAMHDSLLTWEGGSKILRVLRPNGSLLAALEGHGSAIRDAVFAEGDSKVITGGRDKTVRIWTADGTPLAVLEGHTAAVQQVFALSNGAVLSRASDGVVMLWPKGEASGRRLGSKDAFVRSICPAGERAALLFADGRAAIFDASGMPVAELGKGVKEIRFVENLLLLRLETAIEIFDLDGKKRSTCLHPAKVLGMSLRKGQLATWASDNTIRYWQNTNGSSELLFVGHRNTVVSVEISADGKYLLSTDKSSITKLWDMEGNIVGEWQASVSGIAAALFSPDGRQILRVADDGKSLRLVPMPMQIYQAVNPASVLHSRQLAKAEQTYSIQFLDKLRKSGG